MPPQSDDLAQEQYADKEIKTIRLLLHDRPGMLARVLTVIGKEGALIGNIRKVALTSHNVTRDVTVYVRDMAHLRAIVSALHAAPGCHVIRTQDEVVQMHEGGKIKMISRVSVDNLTHLRMIYTPGVAQVSRAIASEPDLVRRLTSVGNSVAVVTNGTAVLGLGDIGVGGAMPVMEGKAALLIEMAGINAIPILVKSKDAGEIVTVVEKIAPTFSIIQLEDISAPTCFTVENELRRRLDIPVFHDDQHGTACVALAALIRALDRTERRKEDVRVVINGAGAAGIAIANLLIGFGIGDVILVDRAGAICAGREENMNEFKQAVAENSNREKRRGTLAEVLMGAEVFIGVSVPGILTAAHVRKMAAAPIVFAMANPIPEIRVRDAEAAGAAVAADGKTINNALGFPGIFRGALDARATEINSAMIHAAARSLAEQAKGDALLPDFLLRAVHAEVAQRVREAAEKTGVAQPQSVTDWLHGDEI